MRSCAAIIGLFLGFFFTQSSLHAQTIVNPADLHAFSAVCSGSSALPLDLTALRGRRDKLLLVTDSARLPDFFLQLPADIRADTGASTGLVGCLAVTERILEQCNFSIFFIIPRSLRSYRLRVFSVLQPATILADFTVDGMAPRSCQNAGALTASTRLQGELPTTAMLLAAFAAHNMDGADADKDGLSNLRELVLGANANDHHSPGPVLTVSVNQRADNTLGQDQTATIYVSLEPGNQQGRIVDYYLYVDSLTGVVSYVHPGRTASGRQLAIRARAVRLNEYPTLVLEDLAAGEYQVHFELLTAEGNLLESTAHFTVVPANWHFTDVTQEAGFRYAQGYAQLASGIIRDLSVLAGGGVAAGDYDGDGWSDLYITRGTIGSNLLFHNRGDGTFEERGQAAGVALQGQYHAGATFADYDNDGYPDLFISGFNDTLPTLFHNDGDGTFTDVTGNSGLAGLRQSFSSSFGDIDHDGDLDLWITHYLFNHGGGYLWRNNGDGSFSDISAAAGIQNNLLQDWSANFADIDDDGWLDILVAADFSTSRIYHNNGNGTFTTVGNAAISDENGMGSAVGDYDNDGDLDWFVSSIFDPEGGRRLPGTVPWGASGNRLYRNDRGTFTDVTESTGTRLGSWGWGSCFDDFNNDGALDLFQTNGLRATPELLRLVYSFTYDTSKLFVADGSSVFTERAGELGLRDTEQGRGIVCFDYDNDGDSDLFIANNEQAPRLYRNDGGNLHHWLQVQVAGENGNTDAVGARVWLTTGATTQVRELHIGSNYLSQNPVIASFGLGSHSKADTLSVRWPSGKQLILHDVVADQRLYLLPP